MSQRFVLIALLVATSQAARGADYFALASGNWNNANIWVAGKASCASTLPAKPPAIPGAADNVTICAGVTVTVDVASSANTVIVNGTLNNGASTLTIDDTPAITLNTGGSFVGGTGTILLTRDNTTTVAAGTGTAITFNNLTIMQGVGIGGSRTYTLGAGSIATMNINNLTANPTGAGGGGARVLTLNAGTVTTLNVTGTTTLAMQGDNDSTLLNAPATFNSRQVVLGGGGSTSADTLSLAAASTVTFGSGLTTGTVLTRNTNGVLTASTSNVTISPADSVTLTGPTTTGTFTGANAFNNLTVTMPAARTGTLGADIAVNGTLLVTAGALDNGGFPITSDGASTFQVNDAGTFQMSGTSTFPPTSGGTHFSTYTFQCSTYPTCSTVRYLQTDAQSISLQTYGHLEVSPSANSITHTFPTGTTTVAGNLTVGNGTNTGVVATAATNSTTLDVNGNVSISTNSTLTGHASNPFTVAGNWTSTGGYTASGGTVTLDGASAQTIGGASNSQFNNLTIANTSGGVSLTGGTTQTVGGTLTLNSGTFAVGANTLNLNGPAIAGTATNFTTTSSSNLSFGGSSAGAFLPSSVTQLNNLTLNNSSGLTLNSSPTVAGTLTLASGVISTGSANTLITSANCPGSVSRTSGWVNGNLRLTFPAAAADCTFHLGDAATNYTPVRTNFSSIAAGGTITATLGAADHPDTSVTSSTGRNGINPARSLNRYWTLRNSGVDGSYTATFTYVAGDIDGGATQGSFKAARGTACATSGGVRTCYPWGFVGVSSNPTGTTTQVTGLSVKANQDHDFALGESATPRFVREKEFIYAREVY